MTEVVVAMTNRPLPGNAVRTTVRIDGVQEMRTRRLAGTDPLSTRQVAYICECGEKWVFARDKVDTEEARTQACVCGRTIVIQRGVVYSTGDPRLGFHKRIA